MLVHNYKKLAMASISTLGGNLSSKSIAPSVPISSILPKPYVSLVDIRRNWLNKINPEKDIFKKINS